MGEGRIMNAIVKKYVVEGDHAKSDYFGLIRESLSDDGLDPDTKKSSLNFAYEQLRKEISENNSPPADAISFGTSGWRGKLGKDINARSVVAVTEAILRMYRSVDAAPELQAVLGVKTFTEAQQRGCVVGFDNRFGGPLLAAHVCITLAQAGVQVFYAGESTTGVLSAAVLELSAAFSVNLTPSHNPLEYGGFKFNAADAGPAASEVTAKITAEARRIVAEEYAKLPLFNDPLAMLASDELVSEIDSFALWQQRVVNNFTAHGLALSETVKDFLANSDMVVVVDSVHGASRLHIRRFFGDTRNERLITLRDKADFTFGGVAPEPSSANIQGVIKVLRERSEKLKIGAIIDPDGDRIRFTDGETEVSMNQFGAMAYHFLHEYKGRKGMVAKTVATSNLANAIAEKLGETLFEPPVGFKNFKEVFGQAIVCFEESDGISIIGHTPEKDAYIGLLLALAMVLTTGRNLGDYLSLIENEYGHFYPERDGIEVSVKGKELDEKLAYLDKYKPGVAVSVAGKDLPIAALITVDGRKMVLADGSWLMIRPSGTEPKVRFYVEARSPEGAAELVATAKVMLQEAGVI